MQRREFITLLGGAAAWPLVARAQGKIPRVGFMGNSTAALEANLVASFREGLRELGYEEGRNIAIDYRWADGQYERFAALVAELIAAKVDVIVTAGTPAALAVKKATNTVPLVMVAVGDPVGTGIVPNLARPGGNITGLSSIAPDLEGKRLGLLQEVVPNLSHVAFFLNPANAFHSVSIRQARVAAQSLGIKLQPLEVDKFGAARHRIRLHRQGEARCAPHPGGPHIPSQSRTHDGVRHPTATAECKCVPGTGRSRRPDVLWAEL